MKFSIVKLLGLTAFLWLGTTGFASAEPQFESIIRAQISAFKQNDGVAAFGLASPAIQHQFGDPETFLRMVATAYPQIFRPNRLVFLDVQKDPAGWPVQKVLVEGLDGDTVVAFYPMIQVDGVWRINGCVMMKPDGTGI